MMKLSQNGVLPILVFIAAAGAVAFLLFTSIFPNKTSFAAGGVDYYGNTVQTFGLFGQKDIGSATRNKVGTDGMYHSSGVIVDSSSTPNKIYIVDSGNNRILGFNGLDTVGPKVPDVVIGQPDMNHGVCNGDDNLGFNKAPTASTLCLTAYPKGNNTAEQWARTNIDVDFLGNLYVVDRYNNRVLRFPKDPLTGLASSSADLVWGQADFVHNTPNRSASPSGTISAPTDSSLWTSFGNYSDNTGVGVSVDGLGNVWVADTFNHRVLRFPVGLNQADLVIGQPDFTTNASADGNCTYGGTALNKFCGPVVAKVNPDTGDLYVLENYPSPFKARILVYQAPFTSGMSAYKTIVANQPGLFTNWGGLLGNGVDIFQATGFTFNPDKTDYPTGVIWVNEHSDNRAVLLDDTGNIVKIIGSRSQTERGGDQEFLGACGGIENGNNLWWPGGSIGFDSNNNIYLADEQWMTVYRYALPYNLQGNGCLPPANGVLIPKGGNKQSADTLGESVGMTVAGNQLIVQDEQNTRKIWNNYTTKSLGAPADASMSGGMSGRNLMSAAVDDQNHLWTYGEQGEIRIYQLPIVGNDAPIADFVNLYWSDNGTQIALGQNFGGIAFDKINKKMYFTTGNGSRIFRVSNYGSFATSHLLVDMVIGQTTKTNTSCNQGLSAPSAQTLCGAYQIKFDNLGNLYVVDDNYECQGNQRIVVFLANDLKTAVGVFPNLSAKKVFNEPNFSSRVNCSYWVTNAPGTPVTLAFNSRNQLVVGNDGYYGDISQRQLKQLWFYSDPLNKQTPDASINLYMGTPGEMTFDTNDNLLIQDHTWYRVTMINLCSDPSWLSWLPGVPPVSTCPIVPTPSPTPVGLVAPGSLTAKAVNNNQIQLNWVDTNTLETNYLVERSTSPTTGFSQIVSLGANTNSYKNTGLQRSQTYYYRVRAKGANNTFSPYSSVVSATTTR